MNMDKVECKEVIVSTLKRRGAGTKYSPIRIITEVYEKDGTKIAEVDPSPETFTPMDLLYFSRWVHEQGHDPNKLTGNIVEKWLDSTEEK